MEMSSVVSGILVFLAGFIISELHNHFAEKRRLARERRQVFYDQVGRLVDRLMDNNEEYYRFWGLDKKDIENKGKSIKMAAYLSSIIDVYHNLHKGNLGKLLETDYSVFNKIMKNKISQEYWVDIVRSHLFGSPEHEIVKVVDQLVEKYRTST